jgi:ABC-2 type transport system permease protein
MTAAETIPETIEAPEEALTPREQRLERAAGVLRWGAIVSGGLVVVLLAAALLGGVGVIPGLFPALQNLLLGRAPLAADAALSVVILLLLVDISLLLVLMVGVLAREFWSIPAVWLVAAVNVGAVILLGFTPAVIAIGAAVGSWIIIMRDISAFRVNPVMLKELRGRMRGVRAFIVLTIYLGLMGTFTTLLYLVFTASTVQATGSGAIGSIGRVLFAGLVGIELLLIIFIAPAFTAGAITGERERQTYDLLQTTLLASPSFVIGKLESALGYILLLLFAAIPLQSIAFLFGGVTELELILSFIILAVTAVTLGTVGIFFSAITPRTLSASVRSYTTALAVTVGILILLNFPLFNAFERAASGFGSGISSSALVETFFIYLGLVLVSLNPVATALVSQQLLADRQAFGLWTVTLSSDGSTIPLVSPWISFTVFYLVISTVLIVLAVREMRRDAV